MEIEKVQESCRVCLLLVCGSAIETFIGLHWVAECLVLYGLFRM